jgi:hypothetical protein
VATQKALLILSAPIIAFVWLALIAAQPRAAAARAQALPKLEAIPSPSDWVGFSATIEHHNEGITSTGRFYRWGDGSSCAVMETVVGRMIHINDVTGRLAYDWTARSGWVSRPMQIRDGYRPKRFAKETPGMSQPYQREGMSVFDITHPNGGRATFAPDLNFFQVENLLPNGSSTKYTDIVKGTPAVEPACAIPQPGEITGHKSTPGGIVQQRNPRK